MGGGGLELGIVDLKWCARVRGLYDFNIQFVSFLEKSFLVGM